MTRYRKDPNAISNHFDELFKGIGHRGSSFMDIDGLIHDGKTKRFLMLEFKHKGEKLDAAQDWALTDFASMPDQFAIAIWIEGDDDYRVIYYPDRMEDRISGYSLRRVIQDWWNQIRNGPAEPERELF